MTNNKFECKHCMELLFGKKFILQDAEAYCIPCYEQLFSNNCEECKRPIACDSKDLAYKDRHWHEDCFKCGKCNRSLVEKPFAAKDEILLCTDCYSNTCSSKCFQCKKIIMPGCRKLELEGNEWHETCFICQSCEKPLGTEPLVTKENKRYCVPCFERKFAPRCKSCKKPITAEGITYHEQPWHKECFLCTNCNKQLFGERFISKEEQPYCQDCYHQLYTEKCEACTKPILGSRSLKFEGKKWHENCFVCQSCQNPIGTKPLAIKESKHYCVPCFERKFAPRCNSCKKERGTNKTGTSSSCVYRTRDRQSVIRPRSLLNPWSRKRMPITTGGLIYRERPWHRECFLCNGCKKQLFGEKFVCKDERPYCRDCYTDLFADKCDSCNKPIADPEGPSYISFQERQWHSDCFKCRKCNVSLVDKPFMTQQKEILCRVCGSKRV
ncbi:four and a half LIM domains protein 5 isoform X2 [Monodelphis domestica]|uniref:four and a half LIM domains protein 5 isoform X2 n=1 Tax=Monodelphis domestica TaxID=13616 RepID=UPI000443191C|nr:four and a half LIM domains protein 5 isoform X2 [Monodelphis domestica]